MSTLGTGSWPAPSDPYLQWDAAYVLGALAPAERREFEQHLAGCPACQRAVAEVAGLPGLLAQVSPEDAALLTGSAEELDEPAPPDLRPALLGQAQRRRRRLYVLVGSVAAGLAVVLGGLGLAFSRGIIGQPEPYRVAFSAVTTGGQPLSGITAVADVTPGRAETTVQVECQYATSGAGGGDPYGEYAVWVRDRSGAETEVKSWYAKPNKVMHPSGTAPIPTWRLDRVEIRDAHSNKILLTAPLR